MSISTTPETAAVVEDQITLIEELLSVKVPGDLRSILHARAAGEKLPFDPVGPYVTSGIDSLWGATEYLRAARPDVSPGLLPIRLVGNLALCLDLKNSSGQPASLVSVDLTGSQAPEKVSPSLKTYLAGFSGDPPQDLWLDRLASETQDDPWFRHGLERLDGHMENLAFEYDHAKGGSLPRAHMWRPYRFCVQDVVLGISVIRHNRRYDCTEVDVFLTAQIPEYEADSGCRALALQILSDAHQCGASMEVRFTRHAAGGRLPAELCNLAAGFGVHFKNAEQGGITPAEARRLYLALTGFAPDLIAWITDLENRGAVSSAGLCYAVHHGIWSRGEIEVLLKAARSPALFFGGGHLPENWHLFHEDLVCARNALMSGLLRAALRRQEHPLAGEGAAVVELEDDERQIDGAFDARFALQRFVLQSAPTGAPLPWVHPSQRTAFSKICELRVLLRGRDSADLKQGLESDLALANQFRQEDPTGPPVFVLVATDALVEGQGEICRLDINAKVGLLVCPLTVHQMDEDIVKRLEAMKVMRS